MAKIQKEAGAKKGAPHHFTGVKRAWLDARAPRFHLAKGAGIVAVGIFYDNVTRDFLVDFPKHGLALAGHTASSPTLSADHVDDLLPPAPELQPPAPELSQSEADTASQLFDVLRVKLQCWFRREHGELEVSKGQTPRSTSADDHEKILFGGLLGTTGKPRKKSALQYYQSATKDKMESAYVVRLAELQAAWATGTEGGTGSTPVPIRVRQMVPKEFWEAETSERRAQFTAGSIEEHRIAVEEWTTAKKIPTSPKQWHEQMANVSRYLQPIVNAISAQMGANVALFIVGPIPGRNGNIEARSIHAANGAPGESWPAFNPDAVTAAEQSMCAFAQVTFSPEECRKRAWQVAEAAGDPSFSQQAAESATENRQMDYVTDVVSVPATPFVPSPITAPATALQSVNPVVLPVLRTISAPNPSHPGISPPVDVLYPLATPTSAVVPDNGETLGDKHQTPPNMGADWVEELQWEGDVAESSPAQAARPSSSKAAGPATLGDASPAQAARLSLSKAADAATPGDASPAQAARLSLSKAADAATPVNASPVQAAHPPLSKAADAATPVNASPAHAAHPSLSKAAGAATPINTSPAQAVHSPSSKAAGPATPVNSSPAQAARLSLLKAAGPGPPAKASSTRSSSSLQPLNLNMSHPSLLAHPNISSLLGANNPDAHILPRPQPVAISAFSPQTSTYDLRGKARISDVSWPGASANAGDLIRPTPKFDGCPPSMVAAYRWLTTGTQLWGDVWHEVILSIMDFMKFEQFKDGLATQFPPGAHDMIRPRQVGKWITAHRRFTDITIDNISAFRTDWWAWWTSMQPQDRRRSPMLPPTNSMDWVPLRKCGKDGIILFIYALRWWGVASLADSDWQAGALDVKQVLACLLTGYTDPISPPPIINGTVSLPTTLTPGRTVPERRSQNSAASNTSAAGPVRQTRAVTAANKVAKPVKAVAPSSKSKWKGWVHITEAESPDVSDTGSSAKRRRIQ